VPTSTRKQTARNQACAAGGCAQTGDRLEHRDVRIDFGPSVQSGGGDAVVPILHVIPEPELKDDDWAQPHPSLRGHERANVFDSISVTVYNARVADDGTELTIEELAARAGVSVRTVRYYINQGLLSGPGARGRNASYTVEHLARLQLIRRLAEQHVPLAEQRQQLAGLSYQQVQTLLEDEERHETALHRASATRSPGDYIGELLTRARSARGNAPTHVLASPNPPAAARSPNPASGQSASAETWQHWQLAPGLELHVRADRAGLHERLIERLLETAREALRRDR